MREMTRHLVLSPFDPWPSVPCARRVRALQSAPVLAVLRHGTRLGRPLAGILLLAFALSQPFSASAQTLPLAEHLRSRAAFDRAASQPGSQPTVAGLPRDLEQILEPRPISPAEAAMEAAIEAELARILEENQWSAVFSSLLEQPVASFADEWPWLKPTVLEVRRPMLRRVLDGGRLGPEIPGVQRVMVPAVMNVRTGQIFAGALPRWRNPLSAVAGGGKAIVQGAMLAVALDEAGADADAERSEGYRAGAALRQAAPVIGLVATTVLVPVGMPVVFSILMASSVGFQVGIITEAGIQGVHVLEARGRHLLQETKTASFRDLLGAAGRAIPETLGASAGTLFRNWQSDRNIEDHIEALRSTGVSDRDIAPTLSRFGVSQEDRDRYLDDDPIQLMQKTWSAYQLRALTDAQTDHNIRRHVEVLRTRGLSDDAISPTLERFGVKVEDRARYLARPVSNCWGCAYAAEIPMEVTQEQPARSSPAAPSGARDARGGVKADIEVSERDFRRPSQNP